MKNVYGEPLPIKFLRHIRKFQLWLDIVMRAKIRMTNGKAN